MTDERWTIREHRGAGGLAELQDDWRALYADMPDPAFWHSHEAHSVYLDTLCRAPEDFRCLALCDNERVRAILPLEERSEIGLGAPLRVWGMPWNGAWSPTDAIGPEDEARRALLPAAVAHLRRDAARPAVLMLGQARGGSVLWDGFSDVSASDRLAFDDGAEYVVPTDMTFEAFLARLSGKSRAMLRKAAQQFESLDGATYVRAVTPDELSTEFEHFLEVEASGWKGERGSAVRQHPEVEAFYRGLMERMRHDGRCEIHSLHAEGRCIASEFCAYTRRGCAGLKAGYDESYARLAPGRLIVHKTLEWCCEDPAVDSVSEISDAPWLRQWHPSENVLRRGYVSLRPASGAVALAALRFRYGPARRAVRAVETWRREHEDRTRTRRGRDAS